MGFLLRSGAELMYLEVVRLLLFFVLQFSLLTQKQGTFTIAKGYAGNIHI